MSDIQLPGARASITAETSGFRAAIGQAQQSLVDLQPIVATQWWGLQNLARAFGAVGSAVSAGFGMAAREAISWESAMVGVQRTTGAGADEMEEIEAQLRKVAQVTPIAVSELASLAEQAGALGVANSDIPEFVEIMGNLIASTNLTVNSVDELARVMNVLQVPQESFDRFASTLLDVGRNTAATETEILNMAKRFAPTAAAAGLVASEVLAISAAVLSLGPEAQAGATAIERTFFDMAASIAEGNDKLALFADISGKTVSKFSTDFSQNAGQTFADFVTGLGKMGGALVETSTVFEELNIKEIRQRRALIALAGGTQVAGDQQRNLNDIMALAAESWADNTALIEVAQQRYGTAAAQLQIFRNEVSNAANQVGAAMLPVLKVVIGLLQDFVFGFTALDGPLKIVLIALTAFVGLISVAIGSIIGLLGPIVIAYKTMGSLSDVFRRTGADALVAATGTRAQSQANTQVAATAVVAAQQLSFLDAQLRIVGADALTGAGQMALFGQEVGRTGTKTAIAGDATVVAGSKLGKFAKWGGIIATGLALGSIALTIFGNKARKAAQETEAAVKPNLQLVDAIDSQARGVNKAADEWLLQEAVMSGMINTVVVLKRNLADVVAIIKGTASVSFAKGYIDDLSKIADKGGKAGKEAAALLKWTAEQNAIWRESASASGHLKAARQGLAVANDDATESERALGAQTDKTREKQDKANQATQDLVSAMLQQGSAALSVKDAQREYAKALDEAGDIAGALAAAEAKITAAQLGAEKAKREVAKAEIELSTARQQAASDLLDSEDKLADSRDTYADSVDKIKDAEEALAKLRMGPSLKEITDATNKLTNAQNSLRKANQLVADAEWQIAYLRGEGASARAMQDAEGVLADARADLSDTTANVTDAEAELQKLRAGPDKEAIKKAERDLDGVRRDSAATLRSIAEQEKEIANQRNEIANDTAYKDAQIKLAEAHEAVYSATKEAEDAQRDLDDIRGGSLTDAVIKAENDLERALYDQAQANVAVRRETALMRGEFWDAGREAQALADELGVLLNQAPTNESLERLKSYIAILRQGKPQAEPSDSTGGGGVGSGAGGDVGGPINDYSDIFPKPEDIPSNDPSWWKRLLDPGNLLGALAFGSLLKSVFSSALIKKAMAPLGRLISGELVAGLGSGIRSAITFLPRLLADFPVIFIGLLVAGLAIALAKTEAGREIAAGIFKKITEINWSEMFTNFFSGTLMDLGKNFKEVGGNMISGLWEGIKDIWENNDFLHNPGKWIQEKLVDKIKDWLGIDSPSKVFKDIGINIIEGLRDGIIQKAEEIWQWLRELPGRLLGYVGGAGGWLVDTGRNLIGGLITGFGNGIGFIGNEAQKIPGKVWETLAGAWSIGGDMYNAGKNLVIGLANGFGSMLNWLKDQAVNLGKTVYEGVKKGVGKLWPLSPSKAGIDIGVGLGTGIRKGIKDITPTIQASASLMAKNLTDQMIITPSISAQFNDQAFTDLALRAGANSGTFGGPSASSTSTVIEKGDTFQITGADERSALDISEEVMFKKLVKTGG